MAELPTAFVILALDRADVESAYEKAIAPALRDSGLEPTRVDRTEGLETITARILTDISEARLVIADLTHERPNCYYEAGFRMALDLPCILTARADHDPRGLGRTLKSPKVHFDLDSHKITYWSPEELDKMRLSLRDRIATALKMRSIRSTEALATPEAWELYAKERSTRSSARPVLDRIIGRGYWEVNIEPISYITSRTPKVVDLISQLQSCVVQLPNWGLPYVDQPRKHEVHQGHIVYEEDAGIILESWSLFQSGQFVYLFGMPEDWMDHRAVAPPPEGWEKGREFFAKNGVFRITALVEFARRHASVVAPDEGVRLTIGIGKLQGRALAETQLPLIKEVTGVTSSASFSSTVTIDSGMTRDRIREVAVDVALELFALFKWSPRRSLIENWQKEVQV